MELGSQGFKRGHTASRHPKLVKFGIPSNGHLPKPPVDRIPFFTSTGSLQLVEDDAHDGSPRHAWHLKETPQVLVSGTQD